MNETQPPRRIGRSIGALLAGMFAGVILSLGTDMVGFAAAQDRGMALPEGKLASLVF